MRLLILTFLAYPDWHVRDTVLAAPRSWRSTHARRPAMGIAEIVPFIFHVVGNGHLRPLATHGAIGIQVRASWIFAIRAPPRRVTSLCCVFVVPLLDVSSSKLCDRLVDLALRALLVRDLI